jgi:hypothetical protein
MRGALVKTDRQAASAARIRVTSLVDLQKVAVQQKIKRGRCKGTAVARWPDAGRKKILRHTQDEKGPLRSHPRGASTSFSDRLTGCYKSPPEEYGAVPDDNHIFC